MQEIYVIVKRDGERYTAQVPGVLDTIIKAADLSELEQQITHRLSEKEGFEDVTFTIVRKMVREISTLQEDKDKELESDGVRWILWRQDGRGERFQVSSHASAREAERECDKLKAKGNKQLYWVEPEHPALTPEDSNDIWEFE